MIDLLHHDPASAGSLGYGIHTSLICLRRWDNFKICVNAHIYIEAGEIDWPERYMRCVLSDSATDVEHFHLGQLMRTIAADLGVAVLSLRPGI